MKLYLHLLLLSVNLLCVSLTAEAGHLITLKGHDTVSVPRDSVYKDSGYVVNPGADSAYIRVTFTTDLDIRAYGAYHYQYTAIDTVGLDTEIVTRTVKVVDKAAPWITLKGDAVIKLCQYFPYTEPGYTVWDHGDDTSGIKVTISGTFTNTLKTGIFFIEYTATDKSGNVSNPAFRYIYITNDPFECGISVNEKTKAENLLQIYPQPSAGIITISYPVKMTLKNYALYDEAGRQVLLSKTSSVFSGITQIDLQNQKPGVYYLQLETDYNLITRKIIIEK